MHAVISRRKLIAAATLGAAQPMLLFGATQTTGWCQSPIGGATAMACNVN